MRHLLLGLFGLVALSTAGATPASAQEYPWCAHMTSRDLDGAVTCGFVSIGQCRAYLSGLGGHCLPNPHYAYGQQPRDPRPVRRAPARRY